RTHGERSTEAEAKGRSSSKAKAGSEASRTRAGQGPGGRAESSRRGKRREQGPPRTRPRRKGASRGRGQDLVEFATRQGTLKGRERDGGGDAAGRDQRAVRGGEPRAFRPVDGGRGPAPTRADHAQRRPCGGRLVRLRRLGVERGRRALLERRPRVGA